MSRRFPRLVMTEASLLTLPPQRREPVKLINLSAGGARVRAAFSLTPRARVLLHLILGTSLRQTVPARVVYCHRDRQTLHYESGLLFAGAEQDGIAAIARYVEEETKRRRSGVVEPG
jgi:hypothetical protein